MVGSFGRRARAPTEVGAGNSIEPLGPGTVEERRTLILETAACHFEEKGYAGTSVDDIARELGITKAAIYHYWSSKEGLLEEIQDRTLTLLREKLDRLDDEENPYETRLEATVAAYIDAVLENAPFVSVLLRDLVSSERTRERHQGFRRRCREVIEAKIAAANVRDLDPEVLTLAIVGSAAQSPTGTSPRGG